MATAPRALHLANPLLEGDDVRAAQQLLTQNQYGDFQPGTIDGQYGPGTADAVRRAQLALGYAAAAANGVFDAKLQAFLEGTPLPAAFAARREARAQAAPGQDALRAQIVDNGRWGIANEPQIHYRQLRPMDALNAPRRLPLNTDCSGFATLCYRWAGAPDPNGLKYNGQGFTGTLLQHCRHILQSAVKPGDLVVWGAYPGHHVALVLEAGPDPLLASHGQEKGPAAIAFSVETAYQPQPVAWLSALD